MEGLDASNAYVQCGPNRIYTPMTAGLHSLDLAGGVPSSFVSQLPVYKQLKRLILER